MSPRRLPFFLGLARRRTALPDGRCVALRLHFAPTYAGQESGPHWLYPAKYVLLISSIIPARKSACQESAEAIEPLRLRMWPELWSVLSSRIALRSYFLSC